MRNSNQASYFNWSLEGRRPSTRCCSKVGYEAVVFNSDFVNPVIFSDWLYELPDTIAQIVAFYLSAHVCFVDPQIDDLHDFVAYYSTGRIVDIRMANDPLTRVLFAICRNNLPHAPIIWLPNSLKCGNYADGSVEALTAAHSMESVIRELHACAP
jgi:hypothetical protein